MGPGRRGPRPAAIALRGVPGMSRLALRGILDHTPSRIACFDRAGCHLYANAEYCAFAGRTQRQVVGRGVREVLGPGAARRLVPARRAALAGRATRWQGWIEKPDDLANPAARAFVDRVCGPLRDLRGRILGWFIAVRDLTELKRHEHALAGRNAQLEAILTRIGDGVNIVDPDCRVVLSNRGFLQMYGFPEELGRPGTPLEAYVRWRLSQRQHYAHEVPGRPMEELVAERVAALRETPPGRHEETRPDGRVIEVRRDRLSDGTLVSTYTDITARREAERARRAQREALRRAERLAATASLLAGVAHEINNPLAVVSAQALLLAEEAEGTPLAERAEKVRLAAERCGRIVASLLASARRRTPRRERVEVARAIADGLDLATDALREAGVALEVEVEPGLPPLQGDPEQIAHLVGNLAGNAQAALQAVAGPRRLRVAAARAGAMLEIAVADNGPGIPEALRERVFDPFFTTKPEGEGTGVGLALCRTIAKAHGGTIAAEATPGGGATLRVRLPLRAEA